MPPFPLEFCLAAGNLDPALSAAANLANCRGVSAVAFNPLLSVWTLTLDTQVGVDDAVPLFSPATETLDIAHATRPDASTLEIHCALDGEPDTLVGCSFVLLPIGPNASTIVGT